MTAFSHTATTDCGLSRENRMRHAVGDCVGPLRNSARSEISDESRLA
jgi:hypothetical protein